MSGTRSGCRTPMVTSSGGSPAPPASARIPPLQVLARFGGQDTEQAAAAVFDVRHQAQRDELAALASYPARRVQAEEAQRERSDRQAREQAERQAAAYQAKANQMRAAEHAQAEQAQPQVEAASPARALRAARQLDLQGAGRPTGRRWWTCSPSGARSGAGRAGAARGCGRPAAWRRSSRRCRPRSGSASPASAPGTRRLRARS